MLPKSLMVNVPAMDIEHHELFMYLEEFKESCFDSAHITLEKRDVLYGLLLKNCQTEKVLAQSVNFDFTSHALAHAQMLKIVFHTLNQLSSNNGDIYTLIRYISYWFERHILEYDIQIAQGLNATKLL